MTRRLKLSFLFDESGVVTVDAIAISASILFLALAAIGQISSGISNKSNEVSNSVAALNSVVSASGEDWFRSFDEIIPVTDLTPEEKLKVALDEYQAAKKEIAAKKNARNEANALLKSANAEVASAKRSLKKAKGADKAAAEAELSAATSKKIQAATVRKNAIAALKEAQNDLKAKALAYKAAKKAAG